MSNLVTLAFPDDEDNEDRKKAVASYIQMIQEILFNIHLVNTGMCNVFLKDMVQPEYEQYKRLLWSLKEMADKEKPE